MNDSFQLLMNIHYGSFMNSKKMHSTNKIVGGVDFFAVHERAFYGPLWTKSFAKSLFLLVHEQLYGIVRQRAFIPRWWTPPNSLTDYL